MIRPELVTLPDIDRTTPTIPAPASDPTFTWPDPLPPLSMRLLREIAAALAERPITGDGDGLVWGLHATADGRENFRVSK